MATATDDDLPVDSSTPDAECTIDSAFGSYVATSPSNCSVHQSCPGSPGAFPKTRLKFSYAMTAVGITVAPGSACTSIRRARTSCPRAATSDTVTRRCSREFVYAVTTSSPLGEANRCWSCQSRNQLVV